MFVLKFKKFLKLALLNIFFDLCALPKFFAEYIIVKKTGEILIVVS